MRQLVESETERQRERERDRKSAQMSKKTVKEEKSSKERTIKQ